MNVVLKSKQSEKGTILHELANGESKEYQAIRGGISWPHLESGLPGYFCIYGEEWVRSSAKIGNEDRRGKLCHLSEGEASSLTSLSIFLDTILNESLRFGCEKFYALTAKFKDEDFGGYAEALRRVSYERHISCPVEEAPWVNSRISLQYVDKWIRAGLLEIPEKSLVRKQMGNVTKDTNPEEFNAVNALCFVVCGFERDKPVISSRNWREKVRNPSGFRPQKLPGRRF